jgi:hypothetical protein
VGILLGWHWDCVCQVMPYSTGCKTELSNFEAGLNYKVCVSLETLLILFLDIPVECDICYVLWFFMCLLSPPITWGKCN